MRPVALVTALAALLVVAAGVAPAPATETPRRWDTRVAGLVAEVERLRGLEFEHPVPVEVLDDVAFAERFGADQVPTSRDRREWAESDAALRALGVLSESVDLESLTRGIGAQVLGFYDADRHEIVVRGDDFANPATRATLVHELTHALQDQQFGLRKLRKQERRADASSVTALIEGDATRVGVAYTATLSESERAEAAAGDVAATADAPELPAIITATLASRYSLGYGMVETLRASGGDAAVDAAFRDPPLDDLAVLDPVALLDAAPVDDPEPPSVGMADEPLGDPTRMGAILLYFVLATHLEPADALATAERLGADSSIAFTRDATTPCVTSALTGRDGLADGEALAQGLARWDERAPVDAAITRRDDDVVLTACAPDDPVPATDAALGRALYHVVLRNSFAAGLLRGTDARTARCLADGIMGLEPVAAALAGVTGPDSDLPAGFQEEVAAALPDEAPRLRAACEER